MTKLYILTFVVGIYGSILVNALFSINYVKSHEGYPMINICGVVECFDPENQVESSNDVDSKGSINPRTGRAFPATKFLDGLLRESLFNTTMNFIVPGFHVYMPRHTAEGSVDHLAMQAFFGIVFAISWITTIAVPTAVTYFQPLGIARTGHDLKWTLNDKVAEAIGLNWTSCVQKTVCQAYENPEKYGMLGEAVRLLFPVPNLSETQRSDEDDGNFADKVEYESVGKDCTHVYRCFFDILDVVMYMKNYGMFTYRT
ncbi:hypothetical protein Ocin01_10508 [Orchesella cincta]|uniref:Uncharacterized protein n=1 Tax=Orchesella cincta TaxID=48709 RepID=A0A1D2MU04_ORCCI|nr:hypothetical protein Ocin01_10508 [Orchesella cincta]